MFIHPHIEVRETPEMGFGVFATQDISQDTVIELSPVIVLKKNDRQLIDQTLLHDYIFIWGEHDETCAMAMGYLPIYNHQCPSNAEYFMIYEEKKMYIKTVRNIEADEQIFINYQGDFDNAEPVWFELK